MLAKSLCSMHYQRMAKHGTTADVHAHADICWFPDCDRPFYARGLCRRHFNRLMRTGSAIGAKGLDLFWSRIERGDPCIERPDLGPCWTWDGPEGGLKNGYAKVSVNYRTYYGHRYVYEQLVGPIPTGLELDHLCFNRRCVNPAHLEPVTGAENIRRANARKKRRRQGG